MIEWYWLLMMMVTLHVFADFHLQGILADLKQQGWWEEQKCKFMKKMEDHGDGVDWIYDRDYAAALWLHAFEWSFIICIPLMWFVGMNWVGAVIVLLNTVLHAYIDDLKCNLMEINLVTDQCCHLMQLLCTLALWMAYAGV